MLKIFAKSRLVDSLQTLQFLLIRVVQFLNEYREFHLKSKNVYIMKKNFFGILAITAVLGLTVSSCSVEYRESRRERYEDRRHHDRDRDHDHDRDHDRDWDRDHH